MININSFILKKKDSVFIYLLLAAISFLFLFFYSQSTSPLYSNYNGISVSARFFIDGKMLYSDCFENEGPVYIFFQIIAQKFVNPLWGTFILQCFSLFLTLVLSYKLSKLYIGSINSITIILLSLLFLSLILKKGNLCEEYSLLFTFYVLYITVKYFLKMNKRPKNLQLSLIGVCTALVFWMQFNSISLILACVFFILIFYFKEKLYKDLFRFLLLASIGFLLVSTPIVIYFILNSSFYEMLRGAFYFNFDLAFDLLIQFKDSISGMDILSYFLYDWFPLFILAIGCIISIPKQKNGNLILLVMLILIFNMAATHLGRTIHHFIILNIPCLFLGLLFIFDKTDAFLRKKKLTLPLCIVVASLFVIIPIIRYTFNNPKDIYSKYHRELRQAYSEQANSIISNIPINERNSVYAFNVPKKFFLDTHLNIYYKYFYSIMQEDYCHFLHIAEDINNMMEASPPSWVIVENLNPNRTNNIGFYNILKRDYKVTKQEFEFTLFKKK